MKYALVVVISTLIIQPVLAVKYYRCKDQRGNTVFSQDPCGPNAVEGTVKETPRAINDGASSNRNAVQQLENYRKSLKQIDNITGWKSKASPSKTEPCDNVSRMQLRNARVSRDIMKCHSEDDIRHIYGMPDSVSTWSDKSAYDTRWRYHHENEGKIYVYFKDGLVSRWSTHK